jgi:hypothetical protein
VRLVFVLFGFRIVSEFVRGFVKHRVFLRGIKIDFILVLSWLCIPRGAGSRSGFVLLFFFFFVLFCHQLSNLICSVLGVFDFGFSN